MSATRRGFFGKLAGLFAAGYVAKDMAELDPGDVDQAAEWPYSGFAMDYRDGIADEDRRHARAGVMYYDTTTGHMVVFDGSEWRTIDAV